MSLAEPEANPRVKLGDNAPPDPFGAIVAHVEDTLTEVRHYADGSPITSQAMADEVSGLIDVLRKAEKVADEARVKEAAPFNEEVAAVQAKYNVYIAPLKNRAPGKIPLAIDALKKTLAPWLQAIEDENNRKATEARQAAQKAAQEAAEAVRAAQATSDLEARERAEALVTQARAAETAAARTEGAKAHATGGERAIGLKDHWIPKLTDGQAALRHYWTMNRLALEAFALDLAVADVRAGKRQIPGFDVINERRV